jgi:hypothetical protein
MKRFNYDNWPNLMGPIYKTITYEELKALLADKERMDYLEQNFIDINLGVDENGTPKTARIEVTRAGIDENIQNNKKLS